MNYKIEPINNKEYHLLQANLMKGSLVYPKWFCISKATIFLKALGDFQIVNKSKWKSDFYVKHKEKNVLEFIFSWRGTIQINSYFEEEIKKYLLRRKGFWNNSYYLIDVNNKEICRIQSKFSWKNFKASYQIETLNNEVSNQNEVLYLSLVHSITLINAMAAAVV